MSDFNANEFNDEIKSDLSGETKEPENHEYEDIMSGSAELPEEEGSYEWNPERSAESANSEYHYSYVNGNNSDASHNPNNYESAYSTPVSTDSSSNEGTSAHSNPAYTDYSSNASESYSGYSSNRDYSRQEYSPYSNYSQSGSYTGGYSSNNSYSAQQAPKAKQEKKKREKKPASRGFVAAMLAVALVGSAALGFGGGYLAKNMNTTTSGNLTINQVESDSKITKASSSSATTTSEIVKKTADSVVEIATEGTTTGMFARQYVTKGAGSGVIISQDGYIVTNHHVIDGANTITVTLRDGTTTYDATLIGSDEDQDIALLKINAEGLSAATFGDSSSLAVGDYVVAIGNPLGTLGGTVTDGIISALAREVTIEDNDMTLLQTNAQISPGNSGGGLFNAKGELIGIVNAKDSATEVEGIAFAIPVNNVLDIIKDLQNYGYVTGKIDLGMSFVDINSNDTAFYYGVNKLGCYVLSVDADSNAEKAGFVRGDLITAVNGTEVSTSSEIDKALESSKVGDTVKITVSRNGQSLDLKLTLAEYVPSAKLNSNADSSDSGSGNSQQYPQGQDFWEQIFGY